MKVLFVAGYGPIVADDRGHDAAAFYEDALNIEFEHDGEYRHTGNLDGVKHFALWPVLTHDGCGTWVVLAKISHGR